MRGAVSWAVLAITILFAGRMAEAQPAQMEFTDQRMERRTGELLRRMTLEEKIGQLTQLFYNLPSDVKPEELIRKGEAGSLLFVKDPATVNRLQHIAVNETRLHIPLLIGFDVTHGYHTIFPVPIGLAATWDTILVDRVAATEAGEASAAGVKWVFAPMVDIARDARWGRMAEGAGEDPVLGAAMAKAEVQGLQGPYTGSPGHVLACVKHFAGYGAAEGGRDYDSSYIPEELLRNVYLPPFRAAVDAGAATVMSAYMDLNDVPATGNPFLLQQILRREWNFHGFVVSDAFAVRDLVTHGFAANAPEAAYRAFTAGVDMDMGSRTYLENLARLVKTGRIHEEAIDAAVRPILLAKFRLGLFEHPYVNMAGVPEVFHARESRKLARLAASRAAVLLKNENEILPLSKSIRSIAVIGPLADSRRDTEGPWSLASDRAEAVTILDGIRTRAGSFVHVEYARGGEIPRKFPSIFDTIFPPPKTVPLTEGQIQEEIRQAAALAARSDIAVVVLGEAASMSGEAASVSTLALPGKQEQLLEAVAAAGKPVVLVLMSGRPLDIHWAAAHVPAILEAWFPGSEGGNGIADVLFGDADPGGRLPVTWPRSTGQVPIYYAHNLTHQPNTADAYPSPLYPFGYGLSYAKFSFNNLKLARSEILTGQTLYVSVDVTNTSGREGSEVAQLYIHQRAGSASRPERQLKDFERMTLTPGEKKTVHFSLSKDDLSFWSPQTKKWVEEPGTYDLWVGSDANASMHATFSLVQ